MKNGGWLDKFDTPKAENGIEGTMGGLTDKGFNFNPAWGGAWRDGGMLQPPMAGADQTVPMYAMGGSLPGSVGFTYARTAGAAPSEGPYAKKTLPSAQNGAEMSFYQQGLDWKPKNISRNGGWLDKFDDEVPEAQNGRSLYNLYQKSKQNQNLKSISQPAKKSNVLTQLSPEEIYYANQLNKYGRTKEDIERARKEAELPFLLATGAIAAPLAGLGAASAAPAIGAGLSYAPIASAPGATLGNLLTSAGIVSAVNNLPNTGRSVGQAIRTGNIGDIGEAALNVGLTGADLLPVYGPIAQTARNVAQHPLVSTLPYVVQNRAVKDYLGATAFAAINRAAPILSKAPVLKDIYKGGAERIASASLGQTRDLSQIIRALRGKNFRTFEGPYKGMTSTPASGYSADRNLVRNYIYGDTRGFEQSDIPLINLNKYINRYGQLKKYKLDASQLQDEDYPFEFLAKEASWNNKALEEPLRGLETPEEIIDKLKEIARREGMVGIGSESNNIGFDDIAGHMKYLIHDPVTDTYKVRTQDIWKFTPEDYNPKWLSENFDKRSFNKNKIDLKTYLGDYMKSKQASLMDKAGKPFVTLDERPLAITKRPERVLQPLEVKVTDYTPQELEEMGLSAAEIKDVLVKKDILAKQKLNLLDWESTMTDFSKPITGFSNKIKDLNFADLTEKKSRLKRKQGGSIPKFQIDVEAVKDNEGYWNPENWGKVVEIDSNNITMKGVNQPLIGVSDEGDVKYMEPGKDYKFKGKKVKEYPIGAQGVSVNKADEYPLEKLDNLLNFTNYNKPKAKNGWLEKYK
jgi:hypothetical protein